MVGPSLKMESGELCGRQPGGGFKPIPPDSIRYVREYAFNNPFLLVVSNGRKYEVRPWSRQYEDIVDFIERYTEFHVKNCLAHKWNCFWCLPFLFYWRLRRHL